MGRFKGLVFGWEGVLVDTREAYFKSVNNVLKRHGHKEISRQTFDLLFVKGSVRMFITLGYPDKAEELTAERREEYDRLVDSFTTNQKECDCVQQLCAGCMHKLKEKGYLIAIATNSHLGPLDKLIDKFGLRPSVDAVVTLDEALVAKPNPHMVIMACERMGLAPSECALIGDRIIDMQAGKDAGVHCIGIARNAQIRQELVEAGADEIVANLSGLLSIL